MNWTSDDQGVLKVRRATQGGYKFRVIAGYSASEEAWSYRVAVTPPDGREVNLPTSGQKAPTLEAALVAAEAIAEAYRLP